MDAPLMISIVLALLAAVMVAPVLNELETQLRNEYQEGINEDA